jgi:hypothetical protein
MASVETPYKLYVTDQEDRVEEAVASEDVEFTTTSTMSLSNVNKDIYNLSDSNLEEDKTYLSNPMSPLSAQPEILDLLFATY